MLVDIHPVADHKHVKYEQDGEWIDVGLVERSSEFFPDITSSEKVLEQTVELGLFEATSHATYARIDYVESVEDWESYIIRPKTEGFSGSDDLIAEALKRFANGEECLRVHTGFNVATYVAK